MKEKPNSLVASKFGFPNASDNNLHFSIKTTGEKVVESYCRECPIVKVCFGKRGNHDGSVRVNLDAPLVSNLSIKDTQSVPCGAGIEIFKRRSNQRK